MAGNNASAIQNRGRVGQNVVTFAWNIPFSPTPGLSFPDIGRREAKRSKAYYTKSHRYCDEHCSPSVPAVLPFLEGRVHVRRQVAQLEKLPTPLLMLLLWKLPRGTTAHKYKSFKTCEFLLFL